MEIENTVAELVESNCKLDALKSKRDAAKGAFFPSLIGEITLLMFDRTKGFAYGVWSQGVIGNALSFFSSSSFLSVEIKLVVIQLILAHTQDQASCLLLELKCLHEEMIEILKKLPG